MRFSIYFTLLSLLFGWNVWFVKHYNWNLTPFSRDGCVSWGGTLSSSSIIWQKIFVVALLQSRHWYSILWIWTQSLLIGSETRVVSDTRPLSCFNICFLNNCWNLGCCPVTKLFWLITSVQHEAIERILYPRGFHANMYWESFNDSAQLLQGGKLTKTRFTHI